MEKPIYYFLIPYLQTYEWGSTSESSLLKNFLRKKNIIIDKPHAELWKGSHKKGPSKAIPIFVKEKEKHPDYIFESERELDKLIEKDPNHFLGEKLGKRYKSLPFLLKILDIEKPLSIQAHPNKELAKYLHEKDPQNYPDENHKPEIAISLGNFEAIIGFRNFEEINKWIQEYPVLDIIPKNINSQNHSKIVENIYKNIMISQSEKIKNTAKQIMKYIEQHSNDPIRDSWFKKLIEYYGDEDPGIFSIYLFQYIRLQKGEGIFISPGIPHAYLKGEIIECMSDSDNVVRGGLTKKYKDLNTLLNMLKFDYEKVKILKPQKNKFFDYEIPVKDFQVSLLHQPGLKVEKMNLDVFPSLILILEGNLEIKINYYSEEEFHLIEEGNVLFFPGDLKERKIELELFPFENSFIFLSYTHLDKD